jgi:riboflavin kinase/FMN adenylyltransferase
LFIQKGLPPVITIEGPAAVPATWRGAFLAIGNFDGVHRGHAALISRLRTRAAARGVPALALTFAPHPVAILHPEAAPVPLTWTERTADLLREAGAGEVGVFRTGPWLLELSAREFFDRIILGQFAAVGLVEGPTFGFGRDRAGNVERLAEWCAEAGLEFEVAAPVEIDGRIVSSSRIRADLAAGRVDEAARLLGRPHRLRGWVVRGAGRGAGLGFPTANLEGIDTQIPLDGVYAASVQHDPARPPCPAAVHIGPNITFGAQARTVEAHLIDFEGDLYGRHLQVDLLVRLRPTRKFESVPELLDQIRRDVAAARTLAAEH